ncbi:uncharacterized protein F4822DRAFT_288924 [Hypoxylon trugodes]|uniref:uncharacterized protein n=1 Tax=Hypoxylon trugodes TaxID=326681 RepID=UPI0021993B33|nr:uncharacterized protein F4822DRAFT_288924 [Hypoxylon trugodes]KAI1387633.1 hypothetical protein F4822DRAFT_288924 [Hypoxylon trugodes]
MASSSKEPLLPKGDQEGRESPGEDGSGYPTPTPDRPHRSEGRREAQLLRTPRLAKGIELAKQSGRMARDKIAGTGRLIGGSNLPVSASTSALGRGRGRGGYTQIGSPVLQDTTFDLSKTRDINPQPSSVSDSARNLSADNTSIQPPTSQPTTQSSVTATTNAPAVATGSGRFPTRRIPSVTGIGPLTSHPTTAFTPAAASGSRGEFNRNAPGPLRPSQTSGNLSSTAHMQSNASEKKRDSFIPIPKSSTVSSFASAAPINPTALARFREENIPPSDNPTTSISARHRDSLRLPSTSQVPRRNFPQSKTMAFPSLPPTAEHPADENSSNNNGKGKGKSIQNEEPQPQQPAQQHQSQTSQPTTSSNTQKTQLPAPKPQSKKPSGLPKAFSNLTSSFSLANFGRSEKRNASEKSMASSSKQGAPPKQSGNNYTSTPTTPMSHGPSIAGPSGTKPTIRRVTQDTPPSAASNAAITAMGTHTSPTPASGSASGSNNLPYQRNPRLVYEAKSFEYWSGRFISLQDQYKNEMLTHENLNVIVDAQMGRTPAPTSTPASGSSAPASTNTSRAGPSPLPAGRTMAPLPPLPAEASTSASRHQHGRATASPSIGAQRRVQAAELTNEEARTRRVFIKLEACCVGPEALNSLQAWQQAYARKVDQAGFLPPGGTLGSGMRNTHTHPYTNGESSAGPSTGSGTQAKASPKEKGSKKGDKDKGKSSASGSGSGRGSRWVNRIFSGNKDKDKKGKGGFAKN